MAPNHAPVRLVKPFMSEKRNKYDTDPLDPDFVRRTEEIWDGGETKVFGDAPTEEFGGSTRPMQPGDQSARMSLDADAPTRRIDDPFGQGYPSVFVPPAYEPPRAQTFGQMAGQTYAPPPPPPQTGLYAPPSPHRHVAGLGVSEQWVTALPYAPFKIGLVVAVIELLVVPRSEGRARFHAAQGLAVQFGILAIQVALGLIGSIGGGNYGGFLFGVAAFIFLIYSFVRVWKGQDYRIAPLADAARWLDEKIAPKK